MPALAVAREQMRCWLRCDACARWRLVDRRSLLAVDPAAFAKPKCGTEDAPDWRNWFAGASQSYAACRAARVLRLAQQGRGGDAFDLEQAAVQCAGAASVEREIRGAESLTVMPADGGGDAESSGSQSRLDTSECGSADEQPPSGAVEGFDVALRSLGGRGGGLRGDELAELERLDRREASQGLRGRGHGGAGVQCMGGRVSTRIAFRCEMLMTKERPDAESEAAWRCLTCDDDDDDFVALTQRRWGFFADGGSLFWEVGDPVLLWDAGGFDVPFNGGTERFQRFAVVTKAEAAGADKVKVKSGRPLVPDPKKNLPVTADKDHSTRSKVVLKLLAEPTLPVIQEVHVELPLGDAAECRVVRRPWASFARRDARSSRLKRSARKE